MAQARAHTVESMTVAIARTLGGRPQANGWAWSSKIAGGQVVVAYTRDGFVRGEAKAQGTIIGTGFSVQITQGKFGLEGYAEGDAPANLLSALRSSNVRFPQFVTVVS